MSSEFYRNFLSGWQTGQQVAQQRIQNRRQQEQMQMDQQRQAAEMERETFDRQQRLEAIKIQKQQLALEEKRARQEDAVREFKLRTEAAGLQGLPDPTAQDVGIQQQTPADVGPTMDQISVPRPSQNIPMMEGPDLPMPVLTGPEQQQQAEQELQRKMRAALGMKFAETQASEQAREPFRQAEDERTLSRTRALASETEGRTIAREQRTEGKQSLAQENRLRAEYNRESKKLRDGLNDLDRFTAPVRKTIESGKTPSPSDQFALIYAFNKALDPNSVVRESEFKNTQSVGAGVTDQAFLMLQRLRRGEQLAPGQVSQMMETIQRARSATEESLEGVRSRYSELAAGYSLDPGKIVDLGAAAESGSDGGWQTVGGLRVRKKVR